MSGFKTRKAALVGGVAALALILAGGIYWVSQGDEAKPAAKTEQVEKPAEEEAEAPEGSVELTSQQIEAAGITIVSIGRGGGAETRLSGRVEPMIDARATVAATVGGRIERVLVSPGQTVRAGQALVSVVSGEAATFRAEFDAAAAEVEVARQSYQRTRNLAEQGVVATQEVEAARARMLSAQAGARAAGARSSAAGSPTASGRLSITTPIAGVVGNIQVGPGGFVAPGGVVADVTNPARVELVFNAPPALAAVVRNGSAMTVSGPAGDFEAVVTGVAADAGMAESGATVIRARATSGTLPPAGSAVSGAVITGQSGASTVMTVPSEAVQTLEGGTYVFVVQKGGFRAVPVLAGRTASGRTEILNGLEGGERIAATNAFLLKAELAKGEAEHGH